MSAISPVDVLAALGPVSALIIHEAVRTKVSLTELRDAVRRVRNGEIDDLAAYERLDGRLQRLVDLLICACEPTAEDAPRTSAAQRVSGG